MNKKILVIFLFAVIMTLIIYKNCYSDNKNILIVGENDIKIDNNNYKTIKFLYDKITFKELLNCIKNNDYIIIKNKKVYLNTLISRSKYIFVSINSDKCSDKHINELLETMNKIAVGEIYIINNCFNNNVNNIIKTNNT